MPPLRQITYNRLTLSLSCWAEKTGLHTERIRNRLDAGWPPGQALGYEDRIKPPQPKRHVRTSSAKRYEHDGKSLTIKEWAEELGLPVQTLYARKARGLPIDMIFTTNRAACMGPLTNTPQTLKPIEVTKLDDRAIGRAAKQIRRSVGMTQRAAEELLNRKRWTLWEQGRCEWSLELIERFNAIIKQWKDRKHD